MQAIKIETPSTSRAPRKRPSNWYLYGESKGALMRPPIRLKWGVNSIGKSSRQDICILTRKTSAQHCTITVNDKGVLLRDQSTNGTYVNHSKYHKNRQFLHHGDLISFGQTTFKYDTDDHRILVYRLKLEAGEEQESIALSDDDGEPLHIIPVKQEIKNENDMEDAQSIDSFDSHAVDNAPGDGDEENSFEGPGDMYDLQQAELFMDRLNFDEDSDAVETVSTVPTAAPSQLPRPPETVLSNFVPNIDLPDEIPITAKIKEEVGWNSFDYEKSLHKDDAPTEVTDTIDLCSDDDEASTPADTSAAQQTRQKHKPNETEWKLPDIEPKRIRIDKVTPAKKMVNELPESEKNRLIDAVQLNPELLKAKAHVVTCSRGNRLALDLLGIGDSASTSLGKSKPPPRSQAKPKVELLSPLPLEEEAAFPCTWSSQKYANQMITTITGWNVQWLLDQKSDAPVCDDDFRPSLIPADFDSRREYQYVWSNFAKIELWESILELHRRENAIRTVFPYMTDVKYVKRSDNSARFIYFCVAEISKKEKRSRLYSDHLVLVTHGGGKFLAFVTSITYKEISYGTKWKMTFQMEAAKVRGNEKIVKPTAGQKRPVSVKSIKNIRAELEQLNALMKVNESPFLSTILYPDEHRKMLLDQVILTEECKQVAIREALHQKCIESVIAKQKSIYLIEGFSGTGKTTILLNATLKLLENTEEFQSRRILFCGATNASLDHVTERMISNGHQNELVRFGHIEKIHLSQHPFSVPAHVLKKPEQIDNARLILTTTDLVSNLLKVSTKNFDLCIVDEASTVSELQMLPLLQFNINTFVLAGAKRFEYPSTSNPVCREMNFSRPFFNRIIDSYGPAIADYCYPTMYKQYRMHPEISLWPNKYFYRQETNSSAVQPHQTFWLQPYTVFSFHHNENELDLVSRLLSMCAARDDLTEISYGIIPAFGQTKNLLINKICEKELPEQIEIADYDCFQGTEYDVIIVTAVKALPFEFLDSLHNICVALTRARKSLIFCGNFECVKNKPVWKSFLNDASERGRLFDVDKNTYLFDKLTVSNRIN